MKKIKILMVAGSMHIGGIENQLMHLARSADKNKYQIDFTSTMPEAACREEIETLGGNFIIIPKMNWKNPIKYCSAMFRIMKEGDYDVVHSHELFHSGITLTIAKLAGIPCRVAHAHNWRDDNGDGKRSIIRMSYNFIMRKLINRYSTVQVACSSWAGKFVYGEKMQRKSSYNLVFNSVDTDKFLSRYDRKEDGEFCDDGWINVLNVARVTTVKNQMLLVDIANNIRMRGLKIRFLCAGNGDKEYIEIIKKTIKDKQLQDYIKLLGPRSDIDSLMRKSKAFVLPSHYEGMPLVMIEAQAAGLPCVSANTYSPEVDFGIGYVSWISLEESVEKWADEIVLASSRERAPKQLVEKSIQDKGFSSKMFTSILCRLYEDNLNSRKTK